MVQHIKMIGFFRLKVKGTELSSLEEIKMFLESKFNPIEFYQDPVCEIIEDDLNTGEFTLDCDLYLIKPNKVNKYKGFVNGAWNGWAKTGLTHAIMLEFDNCTHDEENPQPCEPITVFEWSAT